MNELRMNLFNMVYLYFLFVIISEKHNCNIFSLMIFAKITPFSDLLQMRETEIFLSHVSEWCH